MTEPKSKPGPKPGAKYKSKPGPKARKCAPPSDARDTNNQTAIGQIITDAKKIGRKPYPDEVVAAARALWEGDPNATHAMVAKELGLRTVTVSKWSTKYGWAKVRANMSERAQAAADVYKAKLAEHGGEITTEQQKLAEDAALDEVALQLRADLINKHRKEWDAVRNLLYRGMKQAVNSVGFDASKFAKISAETLKIIQESERRSWGIDSGPDGQTNVKVIIERE